MIRNLGKKIAAAAFMSVFLGAMTAQADWIFQGNQWFYQDSPGSYYVAGDWRFINGAWYYFDYDGVMVSDRAIHDGKGYYYLSGSGAMVSNQFVKTVLPGETEPRWIYLGSSGRAVERGWQNINGRTYHFTDAKMDYGFLDSEGNMMYAYSGDEFKTAAYYCGGPDEGWRWENQWLGISNVYDSYRYHGSTLWLYFGSNGKKVADRRDDIRYANGLMYRCTFDRNGVMVSEQQMSGGGNPIAEAQWVYRIPTRSENREDFENGISRWFYQNSSGSYAKNQMKKINGQYYLFDSSGIMRNGLVLCNRDGGYIKTLNDPESYIYSSSTLVAAAYNIGDIYYFDQSGARRSGRISIDLDNDTFTMGFASNGKAMHGAENNYLYNKGFLVTANDNRYAIRDVDGKKYLVNNSGKIMSNGTYTDDSGNKYKVERNGDDYKITRV